MQVHSGLVHAIKLWPNKNAIWDGDVQHTYAEFGREVRRLAAGLKSLGVGQGDRVGVLLLNSHRYLALYYATSWIGALVVPLNTRLSAKELSYICTNAAPKAFVSEKPFAATLEQVEGLPQHLIDGGHEAVEHGGWRPYSTLLERGEETSAAMYSGDHIAGLFYTSGTTGESKGVMLTHTNLVTNAYHAQIHFHFADTDRWIHAAPMFHLANGSSMYAVTMMGGAHSFIPSFEPGLFLRVVEEHKVTTTLLVPTMINMVVHHPDVKERNVSSLRRMKYGGSPMPVDVLRRAMEVLPCQFMQGYGLTETAPVLTVLAPEDHVLTGPEQKLRRLKSCGREITGVSVRVVNEKGGDVVPGESGEIIAQGPNIMKGYWNKPTQTAAVMKDGWFYTGDIAKVDEDGYIYIVDRKKDMIISGGENIYTTEVENALYSHPAVKEATVFGVPDEQWGEAVKAVVVLREGATAEAGDIIAHAKNLIGFKAPKSIDFLPELPKSGSGKILKRLLRDRYWEGRDRMVN